MLIQETDKTISIKSGTHKKLKQLLLDKDIKTMDELILVLIDKYEK